jgi:hypothetical protein
MAASILSDNGVSSGSAGLKSTADSTGVLALQTTTSGGTATTALTIDTSQNATFAGSVKTNTLTSAASTALTLQSAGTTAVTIDTSQNVGIGVTPSSWNGGRGLQIGARGSLADAYSSNIYLGNNWYIDGTGNKYIATAAATLYALTTTGQHQWFNAPSGTAGTAITFTQAMTLDASGNLLVGTTSQLYSNNGKFTVLSSSTTSQAVNFVLPASTTSQSIVSSSVTAAGTGWAHFQGQSGNGSSITANNIFVYGNGNIVNTNNSYGPISDIKLKENIVDATPKLNDLMRVRVVNYNLKEELGYESHKQIGVIAQELEEVFAGLVDESPDKDLEGNDLGTTTKSVKMTVFIPMLIKAIQEQQALITAQAETINALTARIVAIESKA